MFKYDMAVVVFYIDSALDAFFSTGIVNVNMLHDVQRVTFREKTHMILSIVYISFN